MRRRRRHWLRLRRAALFAVGVVAGWLAAIGVREHLDEVDEVNCVVSRPAHFNHVHVHAAERRGACE